jgi:DNA-binding LacI/PurR family transcriptional regulator
VHADDPLPDLLSQLEIPAVISGRRSADETLPSVDSDNFGGGRFAVEHLIAQGRRTIAHLAGRLDVFGAQRRVDGYRAALRDAGHEIDERLIVPGDFTEEGGRRAMTELLAVRPDVDAVFAGSDVMAAGARQVLREAGLRIPDDVALVGYDDSAIARHMDPPLTSVRQPIEGMGRAMLDLLLDEIADRRPAASRGLERRQVVLPTELVARQSS